MILGIVFGIIAKYTGLKDFAAGLKPLGDAFIQAIKMIVVPLVFSAIAMAVVKIGDLKKFGPLILKAFVWYFAATGFAIFLGIVLNNIFHPGRGIALVATGKLPDNLAASFDWVKFLLSLIPTNVTAAFSGTYILPVIFFAIVFGLAVSATGEKGKPVIHLLEAILAAMFKLTEGIIAFAPIGVFGVMTWLIATHGAHVLFGLLKMVCVLYLGLLILIGVLIVFLLLTHVSPWATFKKVMEPMLLGFSTASSEVTLPVHMDILVKSGIPNRIVSFVLPLGYTFNLDGSALYQALVVTFLADAYTMHLSVGSLVVIFGTLLLASKGTANVPSGSFVVLATVLTSFGMPVEGIAILIGVDRFMDMGRTTINVVGNTVASIMVAKWEGVLGKTDEELEKPLPKEMVQS